MKKILAFVLAAIMLLSLAACGTQKDEPAAGDDGTAAEEKKLVIYSAATDAQVNAVVPLFEERYGIEVEVITGGTGELLARVRAALRLSRYSTQNSGTAPDGEFRAQGLHINYDRRKVFVEEQEVRLTQTEYNIVAFLSEHAGRVMTYAAIVRAIWGDTDASSTKKLQVNMANIRKKLGSRPGSNAYIMNELGVGYRMVDEDARSGENAE